MSLSLQPLQHYPQEEDYSNYLYNLIHGQNSPKDVSLQDFWGLANHLKNSDDPQRKTILDYINYNNPELPSKNGTDFGNRWNTYLKKNRQDLDSRFSGNRLRDVLQQGSPRAPGYQIAGSNQPKALPAPNKDWTYINNRESGSPYWIANGVPLEGRLDQQTIQALKDRHGNAFDPNVNPKYHNFGVPIEPEGKMLGMVLAEQGLRPPTQEMLQSARTSKTGVTSPFQLVNQENEGIPAREVQYAFGEADAPPWTKENEKLEGSLGANAWRSKENLRRPVATQAQPNASSRSGIHTLHNIGSHQNQAPNANPSMLSRASSFASRSLPLLNLGLLSAAIYQNHKSGNQQRRGRS